MNDDKYERAQRKLVELEAQGWKIESDPSKIKARYSDLGIAETVPRNLMYLDIGILCGVIERLTAERDALQAELHDDRDVRDLYRSMKTKDLQDLYAAFTLDIKATLNPAALAFGIERMTALTEVLAERGVALVANQLEPDRCAVCGKVIGYGIREMHLGRCEDHPETPS